MLNLLKTVSMYPNNLLSDKIKYCLLRAASSNIKQQTKHWANIAWLAQQYNTDTLPGRGSPNSSPIVRVSIDVTNDIYGILSSLDVHELEHRDDTQLFNMWQIALRFGHNAYLPAVIVQDFKCVKTVLIFSTVAYSRPNEVIESPEITKLKSEGCIRDAIASPREIALFREDGSRTATGLDIMTVAGRPDQTDMFSIMYDPNFVAFARTEFWIPDSLKDNERNERYRDFGVYYGYPSCCTEAFIKNDGGLPNRINPLEGTGYVPCSWCVDTLSEDEMIANINKHRSEELKPFSK